MPSILKITDGTTTVDFVSSTSGYSVTSWNPAVARRRRNMLGGRGPYEDVDEEMEITVRGTDALTKLSSLQALLDQADRWYRGEPVNAVLLHYKPESTSTELKAAIVGPSDREFIELPPNFPDAPAYDYVDPVVLRFKRAGVWLGATATTTSGSATQPSVASVSTTSVDVESPVLLRINPASTTYMSGLILMSSGATSTQAGQRIAVIDAAAVTPAAQFSTSTDASKLPAGTGILRYTHTTIVGDYIQSLTAPTLDTSVKQWGVYLNYRNNSTNGSFTIQVSIAAFHKTPPYYIPAGTNNPRWAYLGSLRLPVASTAVTLIMDGDTSAATLDIDTIVLHAQDYTTDHVLEVASDTFTLEYLSVDPRPLTNPSAYVIREAVVGTPYINAAYSGDAYLTMRGAGMAALWLSNQNPSYAGYWRAVNSTGATFANTFTFINYTGYLTPE